MSHPMPLTAPTTTWCRRRHSTLALLGIWILSTVAARAQERDVVAGGLKAEEGYAWSLASGLLTVGEQESVTVMVTDAEPTSGGIEVTVRLFDDRSILLEETSGDVFPDEPLIVDFGSLSGPGRVPVRLEVELSSSDPGSLPVTTVEVREADDTLSGGWSCAGPPTRQDGYFACCPEFVATDISS